MTKESNSIGITHTALATNATPDEATYEFVVTTFKRLGTCVKHKYIGMTFKDELDEEILVQCLDLALERGDLVRPTIGCISAPEFAEKSHPAIAGKDEGKRTVRYTVEQLEAYKRQHLSKLGEGQAQ